MSPDVMARSYDEAIAKTQASSTRLEPDAAENTFARMAELFHDMSPEKVRALVPSIYASDAYMNDSLKVIVGAKTIEDYLAKGAKDSRRLSFDFADVVASTEGPDYYIRWDMTLDRKGVNGGEPLRVAGASHIRFDASGRVILHRDFWDTGSGFYERLPLVGWLIGKVRARL